MDAQQTAVCKRTMQLTSYRIEMFLQNISKQGVLPSGDDALGVDFETGVHTGAPEHAAAGGRSYGSVCEMMQAQLDRDSVHRPAAPLAPAADPQ